MFFSVKKHVFRGLASAEGGQGESSNTALSFHDNFVLTGIFHPN